MIIDMVFMRGGEVQVRANFFARRKPDRCLPRLANANARQVTTRTTHIGIFGEH